MGLFCHKDLGGGAFLCNADTKPIIFKCRHLATDLIAIAKACRPGEGIPDTEEKKKRKKGTGQKKKPTSDKKKDKGDKKGGKGDKEKSKVNKGKKPVDESDDDDDQQEVHGSWVAPPGPMYRARFGQTRPSERTRLILANPGNCYMKYTDDKVYGP